MEVAYIVTRNAKVSKVADALVVRSEGRKISTIPLVALKSLVLLSDVQLTTQVIHQLMERGIVIFYMKPTGRLVGMLNNDMSGNIILRIAQYRSWTNKEFCLTYAKTVLSKKLKGQRDILTKYIYRKEGNRKRMKAAIQFMENQLAAIQHAKTIPEVMGYEGVGAKQYFSCFNYMLPTEFAISRREHRPAYEPVNALLNYAYAFLRNELLMRLSAYGFELELGYVHGVRYGRDSLALDVMEPYRPILSDQLVLRLINKKIIRREHFEHLEEGCRLTKEGSIIFCDHYYKQIDDKNTKGINWRERLNSAVYKLRKDILKNG